jgi:hypothetical protein
VWKGIEAKLQNKKKRRALPMWWTLGGVAAIVVLMFTFGNRLFKSESDNTLPTVVETKNKTIFNKDKNSTNLEQNIETTQSIITAQDRDKLQQSIGVTSKNNVIQGDTLNKSIVKTSKISNQKSLVSKESQNNERIAETKTANLERDKGTNDLKSASEINKILSSENENTTIANAASNSKIKQELKQENKTLASKQQKQSIEAAIAEAESLNEKEKEDGLLNRWSISPNVAPVYFNSLGEGSAIDAQFNTNATRSDVTMSYGVKGSYAINRRIKVSTGVNRVSFNNATNDVIALSDNGFVARSTTASAGQLENVNLTGTVSAGSLMVMSKNSLSRSAIPEAINTLTTGDLDQRFGFIEIPLEIEYRVVDRKLGVNINGGFSTLFLNENEIFADVNGESARIGEANNIRDASFTANFGLGLDYSISKRMNINLEPKFKYQLNTFTNTSGNFQPFFIGVYTGLSFKF